MRRASLAGRALAAGPDNSTCLASAAFAYGVLSDRFEEAFELADRAVMVHPNSAFVRNRAAAVYGVCGESDKAIAQCEAARRMNPLDSRKAATFTFCPLVRTLLCAPLRGVHPRGQARVGIHAEAQYRPQVRCHVPRPSWPHRRGAGRDRRAPQTAARRFARALRATQFPPQVDARAAYGRPAQGGVAGGIAGPISGSASHACGAGHVDSVGSRYVACWPTAAPDVCGGTSACWPTAAPDVCDGTSAAGESRHRIPRRLRWSTD